jgi:hypothetical protein
MESIRWIVATFDKAEAAGLEKLLLRSFTCRDNTKAKMM